jgi:hypothetical protein
VCIRTVGVRATLIYWASANPTWAGCINGTLASISPIDHGPAKLCGPRPSTKVVTHDLLCHHRTPCNITRPLLYLDPWDDWEEVRLCQAHLLCQGQARCTNPIWIKEIAVPSSRSDAIPTPRSTNKTTPPSSCDQYGDPPPKYGPTRWPYDPTHNRMRLTTTALIFEAILANVGHDPRV